MKYMFFSNTRWTQLLAPLEIFKGDYEHEIIQPWLTVSHKYK